MKILQTIKASWSSPDIRRRIFITILIIAAFRVLTMVPVPGVDPEIFKQFFKTDAGGALNFINIFSGGTLDRFSVLSVGLIPFINASVIFQLLPTIIKKLENMQKEGETGRKKITQYTRLLTVPLAVLTSITILITLKTPTSSQPVPLINIDDPLRLVSIVVVLTAGAVFMMWMGELLTEKGIGNGISILIMVGILASIPGRFISEVTGSNFLDKGAEPYIQLGATVLITLVLSLILVFLLRTSNHFKKTLYRVPAMMLSLILITAVIVFLIIPQQLLSYAPIDKIRSFGETVANLENQVPVQLGMILGFAVVVIGFIVLFNEAAKNVPIYFSRKASTAAVVAKKSFMPMKLLQAGVMPIIFSSALLLFPYTIAVIVTRFNVPVDWMQSASKSIIAFLDPPDWRYWTLNFLFTAFFAYFYTFVLFRPTQVAENLKKGGSYIPGIRPGLETENYLRNTMLHLVFAGAIVLGLMATTQAFIGGGVTGITSTGQNSLLSTVFTSGTSLLITVGVVLDTRRQFKSYLAQRNYDELFDDLDNIGGVDIEGDITDEEKKLSKFRRLLPFKSFKKKSKKENSKNSVKKKTKKVKKVKAKKEEK